MLHFHPTLRCNAGPRVTLPAAEDNILPQPASVN
jgi:hypothetical protein